MTTVHDFSKVLDINGVKSYYLVKFDGSGLAFTGENAEAIFPFVAFTGLNCDAICPLLGFSNFKHIIYSRKKPGGCDRFFLEQLFFGGDKGGWCLVN